MLPESSAVRSLTEDGSATFTFSNSLSHSVTVFAAGDFGGGTLAVAVSPDGAAYFDVADATLTETGYVNILDTLFKYLKVTLTGSTAPAVDVKVLF